MRRRNPFVRDQVVVGHPDRKYAAEELIEISNTLTAMDEVVVASPNFVSQLSRDFAQRVGALADLFESWRKPDVARTVIGSLIAGDAATFGKLSQSLNWEPGGTLRPLDKCFFLRELVEKIVESRKEQVCRLRQEFSSEQRTLYFLIVMEARRKGWPMVFGPEGLIADIGRQVIGGSDFLNALVRAGLVTCKDEPVADISGLSVVLGPPARVCV